MARKKLSKNIPDQKAIEGRPRKEFNWDDFDKLCEFQCTLIEIASFFRMDESTVETRCWEEKKMSFSDYHKKASANGKASLRRKQFEEALNGNTTMLVWLGKNALGQSDKQVYIDLSQKETETHVAPQQIEDGSPIFTVRVSKDGKFERPRPRLLTINGEAFEDDKKN